MQAAKVSSSLRHGITIVNSSGSGTGLLNYKVQPNTNLFVSKSTDSPRQLPKGRRPPTFSGSDTNRSVCEKRDRDCQLRFLSGPRGLAPSCCQAAGRTFSNT